MSRAAGPVPDGRGRARTHGQAQRCARPAAGHRLTEFELLVDSTEQSGERPGEYQEQKKFFSGKKKKHTFTPGWIPYSSHLVMDGVAT